MNVDEAMAAKRALQEMARNMEADMLGDLAPPKAFEGLTKELARMVAVAPNMRGGDLDDALDAFTYASGTLKRKTEETVFLRELELIK